MHLEIEAIEVMHWNILSDNKNSPDPLFNVQNSRGEGDPAELNDNDLQEGEILRPGNGARRVPHYLSYESNKPDDIIDRITKKSFQHVSLSVNLPGVYFVE